MSNNLFIIFIINYQNVLNIIRLLFTYLISHYRWYYFYTRFVDKYIVYLIKAVILFY
jgi:hypothetical protein